MKQTVRNVKIGHHALTEGPAPGASPGGPLVRTAISAVGRCTESKKFAVADLLRQRRALRMRGLAWEPVTAWDAGVQCTR